MALFEHQPYTNFENINLDMILADIKTIKENEASLDSRVDALEASYTVINESITNIQTDITNIYEQIGEIDLTALEARMDAVEADCLVLHGMANNTLARVMNDETQIEANTTNIANNDLASVNRDNALSARISALERATVHDIYNYYAEGNQCIFGSDLRKLPSSCKTSDGYPAGWGNTSNRADGETKPRSFRFTDDGMVANMVDANVGYDYFQVGRYSSGLFNGSAYTVTFAVSTGGDATPDWYTHTFSAFGEQWEVATGCVIKARKFYAWTGADDFYKTISFMGTPENWNTFLNGKKIVFIYVENGTGSVDTTATAKCEFDVKDRIFFEEVPAPTIPSPTYIYGTKTNFDIPAYYIDEVGDQVNYYLPVASMAAVIWFDASRKTMTGYVALSVKPTNMAESATQLAGLTEKGCYVDANVDVPSAFNNIYATAGESLTYDGSTLDTVKNVNLQGSFLLAATSASTSKIHVKIQSSGFAIPTVGTKIGSFPISLYSNGGISGIS